MAYQCPQCFVGLCKKHPLQDSGKRTASLMEQQKSINSKNLKLIREHEAAFGSTGTTDSEQSTYREQQMRERARAAKRPRAAMSKNAGQLASGALNGSTLQLMMAQSDDEDDGFSKDGRQTTRNASLDESERSRKKRKKDKKMSKKEKKTNRKEKKKRRKEEKKRRKKEKKKRKKEKKKLHKKKSNIDGRNAIEKSGSSSSNSSSGGGVSSSGSSSGDGSSSSSSSSDEYSSDSDRGEE